MRDTIKLNSFIIFSAEKGENRAIDDFNHDTALDTLTSLDIKHKVVVGCYKGQKERAILVHGSHLDVVKRLAKCRDQESILLVDDDRTAYLSYASDGYRRKERIGVVRRTSKLNALKQDGYTYDPDSGQYWIVD